MLQTERHFLDLSNKKAEHLLVYKTNLRLFLNDKIYNLYCLFYLHYSE